MKNILHFQVPMDGRNIAIRPDDLGKFLKMIKEELKDEYHVICSPCVPSLLSTETLVNFDMKQINIEELIDIIKETKNGENND